MGGGFLLAEPAQVAQDHSVTQNFGQSVHFRINLRQDGIQIGIWQVCLQTLVPNHRLLLLPFAT